MVANVVEVVYMLSGKTIIIFCCVCRENARGEDDINAAHEDSKTADMVKAIFVMLIEVCSFDDSLKSSMQWELQYR